MAPSSGLLVSPGMYVHRTLTYMERHPCIHLKTQKALKMVTVTLKYSVSINV